MIELMRHLVERYNEEMWNQGRYQTAAEIFAAGYTSDNADTPGRAVGPDGINYYVKLFRDALPDLHSVVHETVAEGNRIAGRFTVTGTHTGAPLLGVAPTGARITYNGYGIFHVAEGKFSHSFVLFDRLGLLIQLGIVPQERLQAVLRASQQK